MAVDEEFLRVEVGQVRDILIAIRKEFPSFPEEDWAAIELKDIVNMFFLFKQIRLLGMLEEHFDNIKEELGLLRQAHEEFVGRN